MKTYPPMGSILNAIIEFIEYNNTLFFFCQQIFVLSGYFFLKYILKGCCLRNLFLIF